MRKNREQLLELRQLRYFITLAEELHFARAAERLNMEQSPLSRAIRDMERTLGVRLFERNTRSTRITRAGAALLAYARRAITLLEQAGASAKSAALGDGHQLRIAVSDCTAYSQMLEVLARFRMGRPNLSVTLHEMPPHLQISAIRDDLLDASIALDGTYREGIAAQSVGADAIYAVVPALHSLANANIALSSDLSQHPLILFNAESDLGGGPVLDDFVETLARPKIAYRANSLGTLLTLVALGHGIGLVGSAQVKGVRRKDVVLRPIVGAAPSLTTYVLHSDRRVCEVVQDFIAFVRSQQAECGSTCGPS